MWELSNHGDMDKILTTFKDPLDEKLTRESMEFFENTPTPSLLLRPIGEGHVYEGT